jgi:hypothetical protein
MAELIAHPTTELKVKGSNPLAKKNFFEGIIF